MSEQQISSLQRQEISDTKDTDEEQYLTKNNLANRSAEAKVRYAHAQANFNAAKIRFTQAQKTLFRNSKK